MGARRKFSVEYKREAVAMLDAPGVTVHQIAADLGIGAGMLGRWRRELRRQPQQAFVGNGRSRAVPLVPYHLPPEREVRHLGRKQVVLHSLVESAGARSSVHRGTRRSPMPTRNASTSSSCSSRCKTSSLIVPSFRN